MMRVTRIPRAAGGFLAAILAAACPGDGGGLPEARLLTPSGNHFASAYSPDGSRIAYVTRGAEGFELWVAAADLASPRRIVVLGETWDPPLWSPDGSRIAYASSVASVWDVWVVPADSGTPRRLTESPGFEAPVDWHPAGDRLAYIATGEGGRIVCQVLTLETGTSAPLIPSDPTLCGFWSPDGSAIAVSPFSASETGTIGVADSAGGNLRWVTTEGFEALAERPWSPDGSTLLYVSRRTGTGDVWVVPVAGGAPRQLTRDVRRDYAPAWSPDGNWVAFLSERGRQTDVWVVPAAGGPEVRVTDDEITEDWLEWRPGQTSVAFHTGQPANGVWALSLADGAERRLTPDSIRAAGSKPSPDGTHVLYRILRGGGVADLAIAPLAGGAARVLVANGGDNAFPQWSPDGSTIAFVSDRAGSPDVYTVPAAGSEPRRLVDWPTDEQDPEWSFDGAWIYFLSDREAAGQFADVWRVAAGGGEPERVTRAGTINDVEPSPVREEAVLQDYSGLEGRPRITRVRSPGGELTTVWDRTTAWFQPDQPFSPTGDSMVAAVEVAGGRRSTVMLAIAGGSSYRLLAEDADPGFWSPDGASLTLTLRGDRSQTDIGVVALGDGALRRLTSTPQDESGARWADSGRTIVFNRTEAQRRIVVAALERMLGTAP